MGLSCAEPQWALWISSNSGYFILLKIHGKELQLIHLLTEKSYSSFISTEKPEVDSVIELTPQNSVKIQARKIIQENSTVAVHHLHNTFHIDSVCTIYIFSWHGPISKGAQSQRLW